jgi:RND family efflux transporter MFP subunit
MVANVLPRIFALALLTVALPGFAGAEALKVEALKVPEWKAVYGRIEARDTVAARARIGGTITALKVSEGDRVTAGDVIATVQDDKLEFQVKAVDAQLAGLKASLDNARSELARGEELIKRGVTSAQRLDQLRTQVDVVVNQIGAAEAQRAVLIEQQREGAVLAPVSGVVLTVPITRNTVIMAGESVAQIGGGGFFLRLAIPERHAALLKPKATLEIEGSEGASVEGTLARIYPEIDNGRVIADVDVADLPEGFVNKRLLVRVPVGERTAILVPESAVTRRFGIDYVSIRDGEATAERSVVTGERSKVDGKPMVEVLTGIAAGDEVVSP